MGNSIYRHNISLCSKNDKPINDPVSEPLCIITGVSRLDSFEGKVSREDEADEITEERCPESDGQPESCNPHTSEHEVHFADLIGRRQSLLAVR